MYSGPQVFVREILQNGVDAIRARALHEPTFDHQINIELIQGEFPTLIFEDNGIGLTEEEVHQFLATIGQSSKRNLIDHFRTNLIGQFGIGLLSCFMVAEEIVVISQSAKEDESPIEWRGKPDGTYRIRKLDGKISIGTRVYLRAKQDQKKLFSKDEMIRFIKYYGELLPISIQFSCNEEQVLVNPLPPPWDRSYVTTVEEKKAYHQFASDLLQLPIRHYLPLHLEEEGVEGVAYILPYPTTPNSKMKHRVYLKGMLVSEQIENLLPDWAVFVCCVVNVEHLRPVASREAFYEDEMLSKVREKLGEQIRRQLIEIAKENPEQLESMMGHHHVAMRELAATDQECLRVFADWLQFETTMGRMSLADYRQKFPVIRYVSNIDAFRQITQVARSEGFCVINAGYYSDAKLIEQLPEVFDGILLEHLDALTLINELTDLSLQEQEESIEMVRLANQVLDPFRCSVSLKKFHPITVPALYTSNQDQQLIRQKEQTKEIVNDLFDVLLDAVMIDAYKLGYAELCLNYHNPLIQKLIELQEIGTLKRIIELLYVQSLLMGHHPLSNRELVLLNQGLLGIIDLVVRKKD